MTYGLAKGLPFIMLDHIPKNWRAASSICSSTSDAPLSRANRSIPDRAIGRTNSGTFASRASAAAVQVTAGGFAPPDPPARSLAGAAGPTPFAWLTRSPSLAGASSYGFDGIIAVNGQLAAGVFDAAGSAAGPIRTPSDWTACVSYAFVSIAIS